MSYTVHGQSLHTYSRFNFFLLWLTISFLYYIYYPNAALRNLPYRENVQYQRLVKLHSILVPTLVLIPNASPLLQYPWQIPELLTNQIQWLQQSPLYWPQLSLLVPFLSYSRSASGTQNNSDLSHTTKYLKITKHVSLSLNTFNYLPNNAF